MGRETLSDPLDRSTKTPPPERRPASYRRARLGRKTAVHESGRRHGGLCGTVKDAATGPCPTLPSGVTSKAKRKRGRSSPGWSSAKVSPAAGSCSAAVSLPL